MNFGQIVNGLGAENPAQRAKTGETRFLGPGTQKVVQAKQITYITAQSPNRNTLLSYNYMYNRYYGYICKL